MITFSQRVVKLALSIPKGRVTTYGRIAKAAGGGNMASQSITSILGRACDSGIKSIPFHRIVYASGKVWISRSRRKERLALYKKEGIQIDKKEKVKNFNRIIFNFK